YGLLRGFGLLFSGGGPWPVVKYRKTGHYRSLTVAARYEASYVRSAVLSRDRQGAVAWFSGERKSLVAHALASASRVAPAVLPSVNSELRCVTGSKTASTWVSGECLIGLRGEGLRPTKGDENGRRPHSPNCSG